MPALKEKTKGKAHESLFTVVAPLLLGAACFILIYGTRVLNPLYDGWLRAGGDLSQHYIGWEGYRNSGWTFPLGLSDTLTYPTSISVIFTDSIPLPAVFFKLLSPLLPETFQYWGLWGLSGFMMTAFVGTQLLRKYSPNHAFSLLGSIFFIISPTILQRLYGHESLGGGQWLVLASLLPLVWHEERYQLTERAAVFWGILAFLCVGIHIYFSVTCFFALLAFCLYDYLTTKRLRTSLASLASYCLTSIIITWLLGGLKGGIRGKGAGEVGEFSANINCLINPQSYSRFLPALPVHGNGQQEGFAWLGLGIFALLIVGFVSWLLGKRQGGADRGSPAHNRKKLIAFAVAAALSFLFALSPLVTLGSRLLFTVPLPHAARKLLVTFRSTGRMVWLCFYIIYLASFCLIARMRTQKPWLPAAILGACLLIQIADLSPTLAARHGRYAPRQEYSDTFSQSPGMASLAKKGGFRHICIASRLESEDLFAVAQFAVRHGMTVNRFWTVHQIGRDDEEQLLMQELSSPQEGTVFLFRKEDEQLGRDYGLDMTRVNDEYSIGIPGTTRRN
ncbi:MAG: hypothetical protein IJR93_03315 [Treponema sp.]|nr:hypothetical protein [Treponema sp.]